MTIDELSEYKTIKLLVKQLQSEIRELESSPIGSIDYSVERVDSNYKGSSMVEQVAFKAMNLRNKLLEKYNEMLDAEKKINDYIETITDSEIQFIIRARFIECKTWGNIAKEMDYSRPIPYLKMTNYFSNKE